MAMIRPFQGSLFAEDFLREAITELGDWRDLDDEALADFETVLRGLFNRFPTDLTPNESQTEEGPDLAGLGASRLDSPSQAAESLDGRPSKRSGRLAVRGRSRKESCQPFRRGVEALRARPGHRRVQAVAAAP